MLKANVITLFPNLFTPHLSNLPFKKAIELEEAEINIINLREYALDSYGTIDGKPYGGGIGMILRVEPIYRALLDIYDLKDKEIGKLESFKNSIPKTDEIILLSAHGQSYNQTNAQKLAKTTQVTLICGRYEGVDARVEHFLATKVYSVGKYVLSGGELPALTILESVTRLLPQVLEEDATQLESYSEYTSEHPHYTRPEIFKGAKVPQVLLSGNHKEIEKWKTKNSKLKNR